ncbi:MAG TPA: chlorite dismutase [Methyloversatilis sp.]
MNHRLFSFCGGDTGPWRVTSMHAVSGDALAPVARLDVRAGYGDGEATSRAVWSLRGITSNERYVTRGEKQRLLAVQPPLARQGASCAAFIPIRKSAAWWGLTQDERRDILEGQSHHVAHGMRALPAVARRLHHCRDLSENEPFDFLTWFEFAPHDAPVFDALTAWLRASPEWSFVEREVEVRLQADLDGTA